jgi:hypothetical protein
MTDQAKGLIVRCKGLIVRCKEFFGMFPDQTLAEFKAEFDKLTDDDKNELVNLFNVSGLPTVFKKSS